MMLQTIKEIKFEAIDMIKNCYLVMEYELVMDKKIQAFYACLNDADNSNIIRIS
jgi:hypothetical protein